MGRYATATTPVRTKYAVISVRLVRNLLGLMVCCCLMLWTPRVLAASLPEPVGRINDFANLLTAEQQAALGARVDECESRCGAQVAIVTVSSVPIDYATPKEYATALLNAWGVGQKGQNNGVLLLLALKERRVEIETGYGVEAILPDQAIGRILRKFGVPAFKKGNWYKGLQAVTDELCRRLEAGEKYHGKSGSGSSASPVMMFIFLGGLPLLIIIIIGVLVKHFVFTRCPKCGARMKYEETVGTAMRYRCPVCGAVVYKRAVSAGTTSSGYAGSSFSSSGSSGGGGGGFGGGSSGGGGGGASF